MPDYKPAVNVISTNNSRRIWSRHAILLWVNKCLNSNILKVDHLCTGAAYCCLMDILFPDSVNLRRVKFIAEQEKDFIHNFQILQQGFKKHKVTKIIPVEKLVNGKFQDNYDFLIWFRIFYNANFEKMDKGYDVLKRRDNQPFIIGTIQVIRRTRSTLTLKNDSPRSRSVTPARRFIATHRGH